MLSLYRYYTSTGSRIDRTLYWACDHGDVVNAAQQASVAVAQLQAACKVLAVLKVRAVDSLNCTKLCEY